VNETLMIPGPVGQLEALGTDLDRNKVAVLCHPHSQYGGSMHDGVLEILGEACSEAGYGVCKFNFRSVGQSEGRFDQGQGEVDDVLAVVDWIQQKEPAEILLGGYSFGAAMALLAAAKIEQLLAKLLLVAPPIQMVESDAALTIPMRVIVGGRDIIVSATAASQYFSQDQMVVLPQADHFFAGARQDLASQAADFLAGQS
jgi:alpha/beta superfamily hydrolase